MPSTRMSGCTFFWYCCQAITAAFVLGPKSLSACKEALFPVLSSCWTVPTQVFFGPCLSTRFAQGVWLGGAAYAVGGVAAATMPAINNNAMSLGICFIS